MFTKQENIDVSVWRGDPHSGNYENFKVPAHESQTILDVVSWIQQNQDATLSYRYACRVGMCGSCAMMVNGIPRWTCRTHVKKVLKGKKSYCQMIHIVFQKILDVSKGLLVLKFS